MSEIVSGNLFNNKKIASSENYLVKRIVCEFTSEKIIDSFVCSCFYFFNLCSYLFYRAKKLL